MLAIILYAVGGFFGFIFLLFILALIFGKKVEKKWELEADFINSLGKEIGEFEIELKRYPEEQTEFELCAELFLRHDSLRVGRTIEVLLADEPVMRGYVEKHGLIRLGKQNLSADIADPKAGQTCVVRCEGVELCRASLRAD